MKRMPKPIRATTSAAPLLAALLAIAAGAGCGLFGGGSAAGDGGSGSCTKTSDCRPGYVCDPATMTCELAIDKDEGAPCRLSSECKSGLYCSLARVCAKSGTARAGDPCSKEGDCAAGLTCAAGGLYGKCAKPGQGDAGAACTTAADCFSGLLCLDRVCSAGKAPWPGAACSAAPEQTPKVYFEVPRAGGPASEDFYRLPFPNDIRKKKDGHLDLGAHPRPGVQILPADIVDLYLKTAEADLTGFGTNEAAFFRFSRDVTLPNAPGWLEWLDITPGSPDYGVGSDLDYILTGGRGAYICPRYLAVEPSIGAPLRGGTTYAVILRNSIVDDAKLPMQRDADFETVMGDAAPADSDLLAAWNAYAPLRAYLAASMVDPRPIVAAAVFTTQAPTAVMARMRAAVRAAAAPAFEVKGLMRCGEPGKISPCDDGKTGADHQRGCFDQDPTFDEYQGTMGMPVFQAGAPPYLDPSAGGGVALDASGAPQVQRVEDVCFALTVPKGDAPAGGWPVAVYAHGTGGSYRSGVADIAGGFSALAGGGVATLTFDGVLHGPRRGASTEPPENLVYNFLNPRAARDNFVEEAAEHMAAAHLVEIWSGAGVALDAGRIVFFGHSQGATSGALAVPFEPLFTTAIFGGHGGSLKTSMRTKTRPVNVAGALPIILSDDDVDSYHPLLNIMQAYFEEADPVNYARLLVQEPAAGQPGKSVLHVYGTGDSYATVPTQRAFAFAAGLPIVNPVVDDILMDRKLPTLDPPVHANVTVGAAKVTALLAQYEPGDYDGHFVDTRNPAAVSAIAGFVSSLRDGVPTFPAP